MVQVTHIRRLVKRALLDLTDLDEGAISPPSEALLQAITNRLRHAAEELEAERLEAYHGQAQV